MWKVISEKIHNYGNIAKPVEVEISKDLEESIRKTFEKKQGKKIKSIKVFAQKKMETNSAPLRFVTYGNNSKQQTLTPPISDSLSLVSVDDQRGTKRKPTNKMNCNDSKRGKNLISGLPKAEVHIMQRLGVIISFLSYLSK